MEINLREMAFSSSGSYLSLTQEKTGVAFKMRNSRKIGEGAPLLDFHFFDSAENPLMPTVQALPWVVRFHRDDCWAELILKGQEEIFMRGRGFTVEFPLKDGWILETAKESVRHMMISDHNYTTELVCTKGIFTRDIRLETINGSYQTGANLRISGENGGEFSLAVLCTEDEVNYCPQIACFEECLEKTKENWETFLANLPQVAPQYAEISQLLWYNLWSCTVPAGGNFAYDSILMSKAFMSAVWSWDHCFNALALSKGGLHRKAFEQFYGIFYLISPQGKLPDQVNKDDLYRASVKPPIHGWCFGKMMDRFKFSAEELRQAYEGLEKWTEWHFIYRDSDGDGIPEYIMGCDSGWDNGTLFDLGQQMETPDLPAFLFLQMKVLARIARQLGWEAQAAHWEERAEGLLKKLIVHCFEDGVPVAKQSGSHLVNRDTQCLLALMPIVIGGYLPKPLMEEMVRQLEAHFLTDYGLATEAPSSHEYISDGYWRGPIWAPSTYLLVDGLRQNGYLELADVIARRFCNTVAQNGAYENFDALTGQGLRDRGYTWTSAAALCMMAEFVDESR